MSPYRVPSRLDNHEPPRSVLVATMFRACARDRHLLPRTVILGRGSPPVFEEYVEHRCRWCGHEWRMWREAFPLRIALHMLVAFLCAFNAGLALWRVLFP